MHRLIAGTDELIALLVLLPGKCRMAKMAFELPYLTAIRKLKRIAKEPVTSGKYKRGKVQFVSSKWQIGREDRGVGCISCFECMNTHLALSTS